MLRILYLVFASETAHKTNWQHSYPNQFGNSQFCPLCPNISRPGQQYDLKYTIEILDSIIHMQNKTKASFILHKILNLSYFGNVLMRWPLLTINPLSIF